MKTLKWEEVKGQLGHIFFRAYGKETRYGCCKNLKGKYLLTIDNDGVAITFTLKTEKACKDIANNLESK
jgi:hypothetical protein